MYFQYPALYEKDITFVSGDALWRGSVDGGCPYRLTESIKGISSVVYSPDGAHLFFTAKGDVYSIPSEGGSPRRLTYNEHPVTVAGWSRNGQLLVSSSFQFPFNESRLYCMDPENGFLQKVDIGPCEFASYGPEGGCVIQRNGYGYISWKRYKGGSSGRLWIDRKGDGHFIPLLPEIAHNLLRPLWIQDRIYFLSDYQNKGNLYSCALDGSDIRRHTHHEDFYVRHSTTDGKRIVYSCGGDLYLWSLESGSSRKIEMTSLASTIDYVKEVKDPEEHLTSYALSVDGKELALTTRGRLFQMTPYKGPAAQRGEKDGVRYRLACWLKKGQLLAVCDRGHHETLESFDSCLFSNPTSYTPKTGDWGRIIHMTPSPKKNHVAMANHRHELLWFDLETQDMHTIDYSAKGPVLGYDWSPCGKWIVYSVKCQHRGASLWVYDTTTHTKRCLLADGFYNINPVFDRDGKYIFFLSSRMFMPHWDHLHFNMAFAGSMQPFVMTLKADEESPFMAPLLSRENTGEASSDKESQEKEEGEKTSAHKESPDKETDAQKAKEDADTLTEIQWEGIDQRILAFPVPPRSYVSLDTLKGQILYLAGDERRDLYSYDLNTLKEEVLISGIDSFTLSGDGQWMVYYTDNKLRTIRAGTKPDDSPDPSFVKGGWLDWSRVSLVISLKREWEYIFSEAWRLQRDLFWTPSMGNINWDEVYQRYSTCVNRISCLSELIAVISDMHGELGTSHAYVRIDSLPVTLSTLGAEYHYDADSKAYRLDAILQGDVWRGAPLKRPGLGVNPGDLIWSIHGQEVSAQVTPDQLLDQQAHNVVPLVVSDPEGKEKRTVYVVPLPKSLERRMRYRQWVESNRQWVHAHSKGRAGYVHIPDMGEFGYGEFMRGFLQEFDRDGLIIDARYNGGGNVSPLILNFLTRKRLGYDKSRHQGIVPHPMESPKGPMVALINEYTGSDGDIFAHSFKALGLGPSIGKRTWGGVVGIWPRYPLVNGIETTQPEYSFWFHDIGWRVENYGVDPTIDVDITPEDYAKGQDTQMQRGLEELMKLILQDEERQKRLSTPPEEPVLAALPLLSDDKE